MIDIRARCPSTDNTTTPHTSVSASEAVGRLQSYFSDIDKLGADIAKRAGILSNRTSVDLSNAPWKKDDADWFRSNSERSHRLRSMFPGEDVTLTRNPPETAAPPGHEFQVLIRQVKPGTRVRVQFCRNLATPIPDIEAVIHALFDLTSGHAAKAGVIGVKEVAQLALGYIPPKDIKPERN